MKTTASLRSLLIVPLILSTASCGISLGPQVKTSHEMISRSTKSERVVEIVQTVEDFDSTVLLMKGESDASESMRRIPKGTKLIRPDIAHAKGLVSLRLAYEQKRKVLTEAGQADVMQVGGWYIWELAE